MLSVADPKVLSEGLSLKLCPLGHKYDADLHDAITRLRILDGSLPEHAKLGSAVNFFAPAGTAKYWVKSSSPVFGYFFYYTLDMAICPYLASIFGMPIWHPTKEAEVDELLNRCIWATSNLNNTVTESFRASWAVPVLFVLFFVQFGCVPPNC